MGTERVQQNELYINGKKSWKEKFGNKDHGTCLTKPTAIYMVGESTAHHSPSNSIGPIQGPLWLTPTLSQNKHRGQVQIR